MPLSFRHPKLIALVISVVVFLSLAIALGQASIEGPGDRGKLHLAVATALLEGRTPPVTQRPPLYGACLALLARVVGVSPNPQRSDAEEYGNINTFPVASGLYSKTFLRLVLWFQLALLIATAWLIALTLRLAGVGEGWTLLAVLIFAALTPETSPSVLFDSSLTGFLLALALFAWAAWLTGRRGFLALLLAAISSSMAALSHAVFQLLPVLLTIVLYFPVRRSMGPRKARQMAASVLLCCLVIVGGMSAYNWKQHGFFGLSTVMGAGLGTKTWPFIERAVPYYPDNGPVFVRMRDNLLLQYYEHTGVYWGDPACKWLMKERGMSYIGGNKYLLRFNLTAIRRGNENYGPEVLKSLVSFLLPAFPYEVPGPARFVYYVLKAVVFFIFAAACAYCVTRWVISGGRTLANGAASGSRLVLVVAISIFWYAALVVCAADMGKPGQRASVLFTIPIVLALSLSRPESPNPVSEEN